jgi:hypothetical protein
MLGCRALWKLRIAVLVRIVVVLQSAFVLQSATWSTPIASAADQDAKPKEGKLAGILIEKKDNWITVKPDGEDEPIKYLVGDDPGKKVGEALKSIFNASRVQLTYKQDGDSRQLVSIKRQILKASGTVTGDVVKVYNDFWVEVKPKHGVADAFAPGANYNDKDFMEKLKGLKAGDSVTITFTTDFERHRIKTLRKNAVRQAKTAGSSPSATPPTK